MNETGLNDQSIDQYAALERLYSERRWAEVEASAKILLAEVDGDLRSRVLLLLGHTRLYGFKDAGEAAEHYRRVLAAEPEALLLSVAQAGLNQCLAAEEQSPAEGPSPADAMPWLEQIAVPEVEASGSSPAPASSAIKASNPAPEAAQEPLQSFPESESPLLTAGPIQPTQLGPKESAELAKGLLGVVIRPN